MSSKHLSGADTEPAPYWNEACKVLADTDPVLGAMIDAAGGAVLRPRSDPFFSLARSIVGQQISVKAAESVWQKLMARVETMAPEAIAAHDQDGLRTCGLSRQKALYLLSLADHFIDGSLDLGEWPEMDDEAVIKRLTQVKGIGRWTAEMFLIFHLVRPDVLPVADIGIQKAMRNHYTNGEKPSSDRMLEIAEPWRPWRSVAVWYLWRSLDVIPVEY